MRSKLFLLLVVFLGQIVQMVAQDGCTDPLACNYDQSAQTDDGSCCFGSCMELTMNDAFGDGWDNAVLTITTDAGTEVLNATMDIGFTQVLKFCLDDDCYVVNVSAGTFPSEISWSISGTNMGTITGGAPGVSDFSAGALAECGCTDPSACNYAPAATTDDGTCLYGDSCWGCIDPEAVNYDPVAIWDDGNCHYTTQGVVYYDTNNDGMKGQLEPGIANKAVFITETGSTLYTDEFGFLYLSDLPAGDYTLNYIPEPEWNNTSPIVQIVTLPDDGSPASFGLYPVGSDLLFESGMYYTPSFIHCTSGLNFGFFYTNLREGDFTVTVSVSFDEMFVPEEGIGTLPPTTSGPGFATWVISNPGLGIMQEMGLHIPGPDFDFVGQGFIFNINLSIEEEGEIVFDNTVSTEIMVACAIDPNDKQAEPMGYAEPHFIDAGQRIRYTIRFQNTGNAPAQYVIVNDQLDASAFDLSTFEPVYFSHNANTSLDADGMLNFVFNEIYLPDSVNDEPGSHGMIIFDIDVKQDLAPGTVIYNSADIYFEENPAVTTNSTWHTIINCDDFAGPVVSNDICLGESFSADAAQDYIDTYSWMLNADVVSDESYVQLQELATGEYDLTLSMENPLCTSSTEYLVVVHALPGIEITENGAVLTAPEGATWQWSFYGEPIPGATSQVYETDGPGTYSVITTNEWGCSSTSEEVVIFPGVNENGLDRVIVYPNPVERNLNVALPVGKWNLSMIDSQGKVVWIVNEMQGVVSIPRGQLAKGEYALRVVSGDQARTMKVIFK